MLSRIHLDRIGFVHLAFEAPHFPFQPIVIWPPVIKIMDDPGKFPLWRIGPALSDFEWKRQSAVLFQPQVNRMSYLYWWIFAFRYIDGDFEWRKTCWILLNYKSDSNVQDTTAVETTDQASLSVIKHLCSSTCVSSRFWSFKEVHLIEVLCWEKWFAEQKNINIRVPSVKQRRGNSDCRSVINPINRHTRFQSGCSE